MWVFTSLTAAAFRFAHFFEIWDKLGADILGAYFVSLGGSLAYRGYKASLEARADADAPDQEDV